MSSSPEIRPYSSYYRRSISLELCKLHLGCSFGTWSKIWIFWFKCLQFDRKKTARRRAESSPFRTSEKHCLFVDNFLKIFKWVGSARVGDSWHLLLEQILLLGGMTTPKFSDEESLIAKSPPSNFGSLTRENFRPFTLRFLHYKWPKLRRFGSPKINTFDF